MPVQLFAPPTKVQGSFPGATVTVYLAGTTTLATIFSDNVGTLKGNPFTSNADGSWDFWTAAGLVDVQFTGGGLAAPFTLYSMGSNATIASFLGIGYLSACDFPGADAGQKIQAALNALPVTGGTVDGHCLVGPQVISSTVTIGAYETVILGATVFTVTAAVSGPAFNLTGNGATLVGSGGGQTNLGSDPALNAGLGATNLIGSGLGATVDMIRIAIPLALRTSYGASILPSPQVRELFINMGGSGRHGIYATSVHTARIQQVQIFNVANGGDGIKLEGDLSTSTFGATCYHNIIEQCVIQPIASNTTGYGIHFDASHGELAWNSINNCRSSGNITTGGGLAALFLQTGTLVSHAINHTDVDNCYMGNPADVVGSYGIKLQALGPYATQSGPAIVDFAVRNTLIERLFSAVNGIGIGGVSSIGPDVRSGVGLGCVVLFSSGVSSNWGVVPIDRPSLGENYVEVSGFTNPAAGQGTLHLSGNTFGGNSTGITIDQMMRSGANSDTLFSILSVPNIDTQSHTGLTIYNTDLDWGSLTGAVPANATTLRVAAPVFATTNFAIDVVGGPSRFGGDLLITGTGSLKLQGAVSGLNAAAEVANGTITATAAGQTLFAFNLFPSFQTGGFNLASMFGIHMDMGAYVSGGGTATVAVAGDFTGPASGTVAATVLAVRAIGGLMVQPNIAQPACTVAYRGTFWVIQSASGVKDNVQVCAKDATDTYAWRTIY
jgi:hypothetical protein